MFKINKNAKKKVWSKLKMMNRNWNLLRFVHKMKTWVPEKENKTSKSDTKTITINKAKTTAKKAREAKRLQRIDESPEIREERIEWARDKRSRGVELVRQLTMKFYIIWIFKKCILILNDQKVIKIKSNSV